MVNLAQALQHLYPNTTPLVEWVVQDDGEGPYIKEWASKTIPRPTEQELSAVTEQVIEAAQKGRAAAQAKALLTAPDAQGALQKAQIAWMAEKLGITAATAEAEIRAKIDAAKG